MVTTTAAAGRPVRRKPERTVKLSEAVHENVGGRVKGNDGGGGAGRLEGEGGAGVGVGGGVKANDGGGGAGRRSVIH